MISVKRLAPLLAAVLIVAFAPPLAAMPARHAEMMKNGDYNEAYVEYSAKMNEAKARLGAAEYEVLEGDNQKIIEASLDELREEIKKGAAAEAEAYATAYYGCFGNIERALLWQWLRENPEGAQGLYRLAKVSWRRLPFSKAMRRTSMPYR